MKKVLGLLFLVAFGCHQATDSVNPTDPMGGRAFHHR
jgi:hypothetical protein